MFWDDWKDTDWKIYSILVFLAVLLVWNIILSLYIFLIGRSVRRAAEITTERIATSPVWNQIYVPKIPRLLNPKSQVKSASSPQTPSEWFGDGPARMDQNKFF